MRNKLIILITLFIISSLFTASGQKLINSPYARFNLGNLEPTGSFRSLAMGGTGVSFRDNSSVYFANPASYSSIDTNSFVFDFGLDYGIRALRDGGSRFTSDDMNFHHLIIGFPLMRGVGIAAGLVPVSSGYYKISDVISEGDPDYDPVMGEYSSYHFGSGSLSNFFLGAGVRFLEYFSAGVNMSVLFGTLNRANQNNFTESESVFHYAGTEELKITGVNFDYGIQFIAPLKNNNFINAGISLTSGKHFKSDYKNFTYLFSAFNTRDTLTYTSASGMDTYIPGTLRLGLSAGKKNKFVVSVDYLTTKWSQADIIGADGYLADARTLNFGAEYIPNKFSMFSFLERLEYRIGAHIDNDYLMINNEQIKGFGVSAGIGIPLKRSLSKTNLFFDYTKKSGNFENGLHKENYYTLGVSLNLYDFWFMKRRYD